MVVVSVINYIRVLKGRIHDFRKGRGLGLKKRANVLQSDYILIDHRNTVAVPNIEGVNGLIND